MKVKVKESEVQRSILDYLSYKNIFHYRQNTGAFETKRGSFVRFGAKGSPDIITVIKGTYCGIECKGSGGKQSDSQKDFQEALEEAGGKYILAYSLDDVINFIKTI